MTKALVLAAVTMMSTSAFASKARMTALNNAVTVSDDVQEVFRNPAEMFGFGDLLTIEYAAAPDAEGGFFRSSGDTKYGVYFGNRSATFRDLVNAYNAPTPPAAVPATLLLQEQNPFEVFYGSKMGDSAWALSFKYSNGQDKDLKAKVNTMGLRAGYNTDAFEVYAGLGLAGKSELENTATITSDMSIRIGGEYFMGDSIAFADVQTSGGKLAITGLNDDGKATRMQWTLGYETKVRSEVAHFFYGAKLTSTELKTTPPGPGANTAKTTSMALPLYAGVEADATSWLSLRGFVQQSVLINTTKTEPGGGAAATTDHDGLDDTATGLGASLKFGKLSIDGTLSANNSGTLNTDNLLATTSLNYWF